MPSNPVRLALTGLSSSNGMPMWMPDIYANPFNIFAQMQVSSGVSVGQTANLEGTTDYTGTTSSDFNGWNPLTASWSPIIAGASSNQNATITTPFSAIRLNVTGGSSTGTFACNLIQAG